MSFNLFLCSPVPGYNKCRRAPSPPPREAVNYDGAAGESRAAGYRVPANDSRCTFISPT